MTSEAHAQAFTAFVAGLLDDFDRYLMSGSSDPLRDGASYRVAGMWLTDAEYADFLRDLVAIAQPRLANAPARGRRRRIFYSVLLPGPEGARRQRPPTKHHETQEETWERWERSERQLTSRGSTR